MILNSHSIPRLLNAPVDDGVRWLADLYGK
jgi:hypothetical protein